MELVAFVNEGEVFSYYTLTSGTDDLTGTYITSNKPVAKMYAST